MKKDNRGLSLVELLVVIAIIVVLSASSAWGIGMITGKQAQQCVSNLKVSLTNNRTTSMGKYNTEAYVYVGSDGCTYFEEVIYDKVGDPGVTKKKLLCDSSVTLTYSKDNWASSSIVPAYDADEDAKLKVCFNRNTGGLKDMNSDLCFKASKGSRSFLLRIYYITGKIDFD